MTENHSANTNLSGDNKTIALVCSDGLGDGLLQLVFARNLTNNGYSVTFFNNHVAQLSSLIEGITVKPYPELNNVFNTLDHFDLALFDSGNPQLKKLSADQQNYLGKNYICYSVSKSKPRITHDYQRLLKTKLSKNDQNDLLKFSACNQCIRNKNKGNFTIPEHIAWFCREHLSFDHTTTLNDLQKPKTIFRKHDRRVIIHPTSRNANKNWKPSYFLNLARQLNIDGWQPIFSVSPDEALEWTKIVNDEFEIPVFQSMLELANYYHESGFLIGNDSGNGHLASNLGIPVLSIFNRLKLYHPWRPAWGKNLCVSPYLPKRFVGKHWKSFLPVKKVHREFNRLVEINSA